MRSESWRSSGERLQNRIFNLEIEALGWHPGLPPSPQETGCGSKHDVAQLPGATCRPWNSEAAVWVRSTDLSATRGHIAFRAHFRIQGFGGWCMWKREGLIASKFQNSENTFFFTIVKQIDFSLTFSIKVNWIFYMPVKALPPHLLADVSAKWIRFCPDQMSVCTQETAVPRSGTCAPAMLPWSFPSTASGICCPHGDPVSRDFPLNDRATPVPTVVANIHFNICWTKDRMSLWCLWGGVWPMPWEPTRACVGTLECAPGPLTRP